MTDYLHTKFGLIWIKETKVTEGPPQVENVLNRPGEIGLRDCIINLYQAFVGSNKTISFSAEEILVKEMKSRNLSSMNTTNN